MAGKRLDPQEQHDVAPSARERAADKTPDTARTENRMSHTHDRKHGNIDATPRDAVHRRRSSDDAASSESRCRRFRGFESGRSYVPDSHPSPAGTSPGALNRLALHLQAFIAVISAAGGVT